MRPLLVAICFACFVAGCTNSDSTPQSSGGQSQSGVDQMSQSSDDVNHEDLFEENGGVVRKLLERSKTPEEIAALESRLKNLTTEELQAETDKLLLELLERNKSPEEIAARLERLEGMTIDEIQQENHKLLQKLLNNSRHEDQDSKPTN